MTSRYIKSLDEALKAVTDSGSLKHKFLSYGTVIYIPVTDLDCNSGDGQQHKKTRLESDTSYTIDFGGSIASEKKKLCPRILMLSTWADAKFGFAGAGLARQCPSCFRWKAYCRTLMIYHVSHLNKGGGRDGMDETIVETMNREFKEETGTALAFTEEHHCFSFVEYIGPNVILTSMFCLMTSDLALFSGILSNFHSGTFI